MATASLFPLLASSQSNYATPSTFTTIAGATTAGRTDGLPAQARFSSPGGVAAHGSDTIYVADSNNHTIRKITSQGVTTLAGEPGVSGLRNGIGGFARFSTPNGLAVDSSGNVYVADTNNHLIRKITPDGTVTTFSGIGAGSMDGPPTVARFFSPWAIAVDETGNLYVADSANHAIRKVTPTGAVTTLAGSLGPGGFGSNDGIGSSAKFGSPRGVAVDGSGNVYVADRDNNLVRKITAAGVVTTLAGVADRTTGSVDGTGSGARFNNLYGVAVDGSGNVFVADSSNAVIRKIAPGGVVTTIAGLVRSVGSADGLGSAARFNFPLGIAIARDGSLFVADTLNHSIRGNRGVSRPLPTISKVSVALVPWAIPIPGAYHEVDMVSVKPGDLVTFRCVVTDDDSSTQGERDGVRVSGVGFGENGQRSFGIFVKGGDSGYYTMVATNERGTVTSNRVYVEVEGRLANLSILSNVASAGDSFTMGYVVGGTRPTGEKPILIRAAGPTLAAAPFNIAGALADPKLELFAGTTKTAENDNWGGTPALSNAFSSFGAFPYASSSSLDAAVFTTVLTGDNSVRVSASGTGIGTVLAELYDSTPLVDVRGATPRLVNVSVLKHLGTGLTIGFVIDGTAQKKILIRAVGPTLGAAPFNVPGVVLDPELAIFVNGARVLANDNWGGEASMASMFAAVGAFALPPTSRDAAISMSVPGGASVTVQVNGVNGTTGLALVEIYEVP